MLGSSDVVAELSTGLLALPQLELLRIGFPVMRLLMAGEPVSSADIAIATGRPLAEVAAEMERLPAERDEKGRVVGMGLTLNPTRHRFEVERKTLYT